MKKETPILFITPMVQAILNGTKTQTRRVVKPQPEYQLQYGMLEELWFDTDDENQVLTGIGWNCPYGKVGDLLYVRETFYAWGYWKKNGLTKTGKQKWKFIDDSDVIYKYEDSKPHCIRKNSFRQFGWYKRNSLFMPKAAARLWLQITGIRVERLQAITEADAKAEGVKWTSRQGYKNYNDVEEANCFHFPSSSFKSLWHKINGPESWDANPYVWWFYRCCFRGLPNT